MNLVMIAPLYDNRGIVRYFLGAQIDVSGLIEHGRGLDTFARCLEEKNQQPQRQNDTAPETAAKKSLRTLDEFGQMLSVDESAVFQSHSRSGSIDNASNFSSRAPSHKREAGQRLTRRMLGTEERDQEEDRSAWAFPAMGPSGKLPGVYQNVCVFVPRLFLSIQRSEAIQQLTSACTCSIY